MKISKRKMEDVLSGARVAIENAQTNDEIKGFIINYGFDDARIQEGVELLKTADDLYQVQKSKRGEQITVSKQLQDKFVIIIRLPPFVTSLKFPAV